MGRKGLAATTSREITGEADANLAAITYHFGSKDRLVAEALLGGIRSWLAPTLDVLAGGGEPSARMLVALQVEVDPNGPALSAMAGQVGALMLGARQTPWAGDSRGNG